jgi:transposase InsO family protein
MNSVYVVAGISKQWFYKKLRHEEKEWTRRERIEEMVREVRKDHPRMGSRPMYYKLGIRGVGINKFERIMSEIGLGVIRKKKRIITTHSNPFQKHYPNLTYGKKLNGINQLWVSDITYWVGLRETYYITMMQDVYSRRLLGYQANNNMYTENNVNVLSQSMHIRKASRYEDLVHHSDKGSQYGSGEYINKLKKAGIDISMAGNSIENPYAERLNGIIKNDYLAFEQIFDLASLNKALDRAVWLYNYERPHSELKYMTPIEYERQLVKLNPFERTQMILFDFTEHEQRKTYKQ